MPLINNIHLALDFRAPAGALYHALLPLAVQLLTILAILYIVIPLFRLFVLYSAPLSANNKAPHGHLSISHLPSFPSPFPWIGHLLGLQNDSARYVNRLLASAPQVFTISLPFKRVVVVNPSLERHLARHVHDTGLAQILAYVGPRVFNLGPRAIQVILDIDPRALHRVKFGATENVQALSERSSTFIWSEMEKLPLKSNLKLAHWMFGLTVSATASAVWGVENPWRMDPEFAQEFMNLSETFDSLSRPLPFITARSAYASRAFLSRRLQEFHFAHRSSRVQTVAHGINVIAHSDPQWETNPDYFNIEMVSALGLLATPSTLSVWLVRHLLASPAILRLVADEVQRLPVVPGETSGLPRLDLARVRELCPWLVAAWYETLRLHMTGVPRLARHAFDFALPDSDPVAVAQGDIFLLPMSAPNRDPELWGADAEAFNPGRFLTPAEELSAALIRKVHAFGVAGNLCPGRVFGTEVALAVVGGLLRTFEVRSVDGKKFWVPGVRRGFNVGFERYADDVEVELVRRS
ncbi:cytochrome P450 [Ganoderma sinense ZZ0214-1]|uniref:Cytochrome P450 n=1 Tax=Ganoderma sinense ZZ0214-1 TaxID=1077348 RepID=A0A2G8SUW5_9APHY|nr:cytochrome P450 [Ganoderma sinense ZZ0214-1]